MRESKGKEREERERRGRIKVLFLSPSPFLFLLFDSVIQHVFISPAFSLRHTDHDYTKM